MKLILDKLGINIYEVFLKQSVSAVCIGTFETDVDGYYKWFPVPSNGGFLDSPLLHLVASKLDELNQDWDNEVKSISNGDTWYDEDF